MKSGMTQSLLVLPFRNLNPSPEQEYLSDGLTEELIAALSGYDNVQVASRTSSFYFKNRTFSLEEIREKLKVTHLLEGSIRNFADQLRIIIHLSDVNKGFTLWSETFNLDYQNILEVQEEIISRILRRFDTEEKIKSTLHAVPNNDVEAYNDYLKGLYYYNKYSMDNMTKGVEWFKKAIQRQPDYALAYAGLADCYLALGGYIHPSYYHQSKASALKAIQLNDQLMEPHISLGFVQMFYNWDWKTGELAIKEALKINIQSALAYRTQGLFYMTIGQQQRAIDAHIIAVKYDPLNVIYINGLGVMFAFAKRYKEAMAKYEKCLSMDASFRPAVEGMGWVKTYEKKWDEAIDYFQRYQKMVGHPLKGWYGLGYAYGKKGDFDKAKIILDKLFERKEKNPKESLDLDFAVVYMGLSQMDKVFAHLNNAIDKHHILTMAYLASDPLFDELKADERYWDLIRKLGLDAYIEQTLPASTKQKLLFLKGDTLDQLEILSSQFLFAEADGNYVKVCWKEGNKLNEYLLRCTLNKVLDQIGEETIVQSHRSYLINLSNINNLSRIGRQYVLKNEQFDISIPISRGRVEAIRKLLEQS